MSPGFNPNKRGVNRESEVEGTTRRRGEEERKRRRHGRKEESRRGAE